MYSTPSYSVVCTKLPYWHFYNLCGSFLSYHCTKGKFVSCLLKRTPFGNYSSCMKIIKIPETRLIQHVTDDDSSVCTCFYTLCSTGTGVMSIKRGLILLDVCGADHITVVQVPAIRTYLPVKHKAQNHPAIVQHTMYSIPQITKNYKLHSSNTQ